MGNMRTRWILLLLGAIVAVIAFGAVACGGDDEGELDLRTTLTGVDGNEISGIALLTTQPNPVTTGPTGRLRQGCGRDSNILSGFCTVEIEISGLPEGAHANSLRQGSCANRGEIVRSLEELVAGADGTASATTQFPLYQKKDIYDTEHYISVHEAGDDTPVIACGNLAVQPDPALASGG
jgi:hypothetical protein